MATRQTRAEKKAETRERLLRAAERIAADHGPSRVTLDAVAEAAGVTKGAIYSNFQSKDELLLEAVARQTTGLDVTGQVLDAESLPELLENLAAAVVRVARTRPREAVLALELDALAARDPELRRALAKARRRAEAADDGEADAWFARHVDELPLPLEQFSVVANALALGLLSIRLVRGAGAVPDELFTWAFRRLALRPDD